MLQLCKWVLPCIRAWCHSSLNQVCLFWDEWANELVQFWPRHRPADALLDSKTVDRPTWRSVVPQNCTTSTLELNSFANLINYATFSKWNTEFQVSWWCATPGENRLSNDQKKLHPYMVEVWGNRTDVWKEQFRENLGEIPSKTEEKTPSYTKIPIVKFVFPRNFCHIPWTPPFWGNAQHTQNCKLIKCLKLINVFIIFWAKTSEKRA